jgi:EmrB/QacA subfamily drug resistance transporter
VLLAPVFGPTLGGYLIDNFGWSSIFFINLPVGILALTLGWLILPADRRAEKRAGASFDFVGLALVTLGVLAVVYAFTLVSESRPGTATALNPRGELNGWGYWLVWALLGLGLAILAAFALYELRVSKDPVLDLRLFKQYEFSIASLVSWINAVVVFGSLFLLPVFLQQVRIPNLTALDAGLALMPQGISSAVAVAIGGRLYNRVGVRPLVFTGAILLAVSSWLLSQLTYQTDGYGMMPALILRGLGFGFTLIPVQTMALEVISGPALAKASSLFNVTRQIFSSIGIAATITLFVQRATVHATEMAAAARAALPPGVTPNPNDPNVQAAIRNIQARAGTSAINDVFNLVMYGTLVVLLLALALPSRHTLAERRAANADHGPRPVPVE